MRFAFYSGTRGSPWGGSEELWSATALELQKRGHSVGISYPRFPKRAQQLTEIERHGGTMYWRDRRWERLKTAARKRLALRGWSAARFHGWLDRYRPDLVVITWGRLIDDLSIAHACFQRGIPYAINLQVANRFQWFDNHHLQAARAAYTAAIAMDRYGIPDETASAAVYLASEEAGYITGRVLAVDGGFLSAGVMPRKADDVEINGQSRGRRRKRPGARGSP